MKSVFSYNLAFIAYTCIQEINYSFSSYISQYIYTKYKIEINYLLLVLSELQIK